MSDLFHQKKEVQPPKRTFSLFELNAHLAKVIRLNMRDKIWIRAELAEVGRSRGHWYLRLIEKDLLQIKAKASAMIWRKTWYRLEKQLGDALNTLLQKGRELRMLVQVDFSEQYGLSLFIEQIDLDFSIGQLEQQRLQTAERLKKEQLLDKQRQLRLVLVPQRLAVISSESAAGWEDFQVQLQQNPYGFHFDCQLFSSSVQGINAPKEIVQRLSEINQSPRDFDAILLLRGGGSKLDLQAFDDYEVCRSVAQSRLPVLSGIGHERDFSLADTVAFQSLKTPTAVADFLIDRALQLQGYLQELRQRLQGLSRRSLQQARQRLQQWEQLLPLLQKRYFDQQREKLRNYQKRLELLQPENSLKRGFIWVLQEGKIVKNLQKIAPGTRLELRGAEGSIFVVVE